MPGTNPRSSPPVTSRMGTGSDSSVASTSRTPSTARSAKSWSSSWAVKLTRTSLETRKRSATSAGDVADPRSFQAALRRVGEVFVLRELAQRLGLDLAHTLPRQAELLADRLERRRPLADEAEAELDHVALPIRQVRDRLAHRQVAERGRGLLLGGRAGAGDRKSVV